MNIADEPILAPVIGILILLASRFFKLFRGRISDRSGYLGAKLHPGAEMSFTHVEFMTMTEHPFFIMAGIRSAHS